MDPAHLRRRAVRGHHAATYARAHRTALRSCDWVFLRNPATKKSLVTGLLPTRTGRVHTVAALDSPDMPCCRRADLTALGRGPKSWSWTIKGSPSPPALRATPPPFCSQICSAMSLRYCFKPDHAAHTMSHLTAHPTTPIDFPLVHASQCSRSKAVLFVPHSPVPPAHAASAHVLRCTNLLSGEVHET